MATLWAKKGIYLPLSGKYREMTRAPSRTSTTGGLLSSRHSYAFVGVSVNCGSEGAFRLFGTSRACLDSVPEVKQRSQD